jgi:streptogramin lyase
MLCRESERLRCEVALTRNRRWGRALARAFALGATVALLAGFGSASAASPEPAFGLPPFAPPPPFVFGPPPSSSVTFTSIPIPNGTLFMFTPTVGPDGNIWFPMSRPASIVRVLSHPPYTVTEFPLADDTYPSGNPVIGPDGNLWFTEQGDFESESSLAPGKIVRILPHPPYTITEFNTSHPQDRPRPFGLVVGPDRNIYYTEVCDQNDGTVNCPNSSSGSVGRITPFGSDAQIQASATEVVPKISTCTDEMDGFAPCDGPNYITLGPDGNLWFVTTFAINRLTVPRYELSRFPVPGQSTPPFPYRDYYLAFGITIGSDRNIWFTGGFGPAGNHIGWLSPRAPNNITLYPVSTTNTNPDPLGITTGQDGNLYFAMGFNNGVGAINPFSLNKEVTDYTIPGSGVFVHGVTAGPCDNSIWVTDGGQTAIVRIQLPGPPFPIHDVAEDFGHPGFLCHRD